MMLSRTRIYFVLALILVAACKDPSGLDQESREKFIKAKNDFVSRAAEIKKSPKVNTEKVKAIYLRGYDRYDLLTRTIPTSIRKGEDPEKIKKAVTDTQSEFTTLTRELNSLDPAFGFDPITLIVPAVTAALKIIESIQERNDKDRDRIAQLLEVDLKKEHPPEWQAL